MDAGLLPDGTVTDLSVQTQTPMPGTGYIDLVVTCVIADKRCELWGELKVAAGESGTQLDVYRRHIQELRGPVRPVLFTLGPRPIRDDPTIPFLSWHALRRRTLSTSVAQAWADFADYLAEVGVSDDFDQPVAAREAASMTDFGQLLGKTVRILEGVTHQATIRWPEFAWPQSRAALSKDLTRRFWEFHQLLSLAEPRGRPRTAYVAIGVVASDGEAAVDVNVGTYPAQTDLQREIIGLADTAAFGVEWQRTFGAWGGIRRSERLVLLADHAAAEAWFMDRLSELASAGVLERLTTGPVAAVNGALGDGQNALRS